MSGPARAVSGFSGCAGIVCVHAWRWPAPTQSPGVACGAFHDQRTHGGVRAGLRFFAGAAGAQRFVRFRLFLARSAVDGVGTDFADTGADSGWPVPTGAGRHSFVGEGARFFAVAAISEIDFAAFHAWIMDGRHAD